MVEIHLTDWSGDAVTAVRDAAVDLGLIIVSDGSLRSYPGSRHWHLRKPKVPGTLEITLWPDKRLFWVTYHANRVGDGWVIPGAEQMAAKLCEILGGKPSAAITK